ncbi:hypothetical protein QL285_052807 [Trifolium repens]|nr:hypothetical protein QL285_052807 [Trifolium repens]
MSSVEMDFNPSIGRTGRTRNWDTHYDYKHSRFSIKFRVMNDTDSATFVLFDRGAAILRSRDIRAASDVLPPKIQALMNCTYLFKVECKVAVSSRFDQSFRVRKICTDIVTINQFKSKWALEESVFVKNANEMNSLSALHDSEVDFSANYLATNFF